MLQNVLEQLSSVSSGLDGDWSDRVNYFITSRLFLVLGTLVVTRQFVGESIICWSPNEFNSQWQQYVDSYCWVMNTNYLPLTSHHDAIIDGYAPRLIRYYQWTPLILFTQALLFLVPNFLWQTAYRSSGMDFERVVEFAS
ncbi:innexin unc-9-like, partial [Symsagittifera roscoffensis]|uniref:innexin unc-9-like n=1 Tax=Symsagittifera roscoffensis TaxID=84072 RepID=UPI00307B3521